MQTRIMDILTDKGIEVNYESSSGIIKSLADKEMIYSFSGIIVTLGIV